MTFTLRNMTRALLGAAVAASLIPGFSQEVGIGLPLVETAPATLEEEFFELMWLCDSPVAEERDAAQEELTRRFEEFEPIWQDRTFLTDGEVADEARRRFERAEAEYRDERVEAARRAFDVQWRVEEPTDEDGTPTRRASVRLSWSEPLRFVWLAPDFSAFLWRDPETGTLWRPRGYWSSPELQPEFDADYVDLDVLLEPVAVENVELTETSAAFEVLVGVDLRPLTIPIDLGSATPKDYRSGELTLRGVGAERREEGGWTAALRLEYDAAFDAFDSHRSWYDRDDFYLVWAGTDARVGATRLRSRERGANGERVELVFPEIPESEEGERGQAPFLCCRTPRYFVRTRIVF